MRVGLREWADREPDRPALIADGGRTLCFSHLEQRANVFARAIAAAGLVRGDHMAAMVGNSPDMVALGWGAYRSGVYLTPLPTTLTASETRYIIDDCEAVLVVTHADFAHLAGELPSLCPTVTFRSLGEGIATIRDWEPELRHHPAVPRPDESPGSLMMYSSGTTGAPKGIMRPMPGVDQAGLLPPFARDLVEIFGLDSTTRYLSTAPLYHAAALRFVLAVTAAGGTTVLMRKFEARRALELIDLHGLTLSQWVPTMFRRLLDLPAETRAAFQGRSHRRAIHGAAPCSPALKQAMIDWWGPILQEYYSGTEGVGLTLIDSDEWLRRPGSVGRPRKGIVHILGENDEELGPEETGRVFFSGLPRFEYHRAPAKTATRTSRQGWQSFGDVGHVDDGGYLYLSDRLDDMIISGGVNVYPQEIEAAIEEAEFVAECGVIGVPDPEFEERPVAFVVPCAGEADVMPRLRQHIRERLGRIKQPREIYLVDALPVSQTGKLLRRKLRDLLP
ncbi:long-chain acyl-CoA synthetase [Mesorhizobium sp. L-8-10]|uniref:AMP-binding protein n=1 Tax=Mesorhizobium sp. L-8-10 TaxID=2744523 RepID=UPI00192922DC|nr:AMP-binding protein [Mesorhizobium sp. L-8-10]BCH31237.1 long-chain acyl-CoA synthetase [Mesorhizobium sp. L-8-10]